MSHYAFSETTASNTSDTFCNEDNFLDRIFPIITKDGLRTQPNPFNGTCNLNNADLRNTDLTRSLRMFALTGKLDKAKMKKVRFPSQFGLSLKNADLTNANMEGSNSGHSKMEGANLTGANLKKFHAQGSYFQSANLTSADLSESRFSGGRPSSGFRNANMTHVKAHNTYFGGRRDEPIVFTGADFDKADFTNSTFHEADLRDVTNYDKAKWDKVSFYDVQVTPEQAQFFEKKNMKGFYVKKKIEQAELAKKVVSECRYKDDPVHVKQKSPCGNFCYGSVLCKVREVSILAKVFCYVGTSDQCPESAEKCMKNIPKKKVVSVAQDDPENPKLKTGGNWFTNFFGSFFKPSQSRTTESTPLQEARRRTGDRTGGTQ